MFDGQFVHHPSSYDVLTRRPEIGNTNGPTTGCRRDLGQAMESRLINSSTTASRNYRHPSSTGIQLGATAQQQQHCRRQIIR
ncbi:alpha 2,6 sialyltransferase I [Anopheles sinensis]|uniref:Alpha 2,6 sialyltransferase I n=1 Tax=Anopheles sinensis TaxID=74873 RepID=A0A084VPM0_ANOSI|nr:alpha 2,6 sialyltransferase I [Anopheles sinensis]